MLFSIYFAVNNNLHKNYFTVIYMKIATGNNTFPTNNWTTNELDTRVRVLRQKLTVQLLKNYLHRAWWFTAVCTKAQKNPVHAPHPIYLKPIIMLSSHLFLGFPSFFCLKIKDIFYGLFTQKKPANNLMLKFHFLHTIWNKSDIFRSVSIILRELLNFINLI